MSNLPKANMALKGVSHKCNTTFSKVDKVRLTRKWYLGKLKVLYEKIWDCENLSNRLV